MTALAVTNTFVDGNVITAAGHNTNFSDIVTYVNNRNDGSSTWDALRVTTSSAVVAIFNNSSGTSDILRCQDNGTSVFVVADTGKVGIGATAPDVALEIEGSGPDIHQDSSSNVYHYVDRGATTNEAMVVFQTAGSNQTAIGMDNDSTNTLHFFTNADLGTPKMSLDSTGTLTINEAGVSTADVRMEGDTLTNLFFLDASADRIGIGATAPDALLELEGGSPDIHQDSSSNAYHYVDRGAVTNEALTVYQTAGVTKCAVGMDNDSTDNLYFFVNGSLGTPVMKIFSTGGVNIGSPTGGDKGAATLNITNDIYKNNSAYTNPDYAFEHWVTGKVEKFKNNPGAESYTGILPLDELISYCKENMDLPRVKSLGSDETGGQGIFSRADVVLEKIEEAYLYIFQLHERIKTLEAKCQ